MTKEHRCEGMPDNGRWTIRGRTLEYDFEGYPDEDPQWQDRTEINYCPWCRVKLEDAQ